MTIEEVFQLLDSGMDTHCRAIEAALSEMNEVCGQCEGLEQCRSRLEGSLALIKASLDVLHGRGVLVGPNLGVEEDQDGLEGVH